MHVVHERPGLDALIAATAMISDLSFVSKNQGDYRFIEDLQLLPYPDPFSNNKDQTE
jgi:predicted nucleic acid-binding protein